MQWWASMSGLSSLTKLHTETLLSPTEKELAETLDCWVLDPQRTAPVLSSFSLSMFTDVLAFNSCSSSKDFEPLHGLLLDWVENCHTIPESSADSCRPVLYLSTTMPSWRAKKNWFEHWPLWYTTCEMGTVCRCRIHLDKLIPICKIWLEPLISQIWNAYFILSSPITCHDQETSNTHKKVKNILKKKKKKIKS